MVNLLSTKAQRALILRYRVRLISVFAVLAAAGIASGAALMMPSYLLAKGQADAAHRFVAASEQAVALGSGGGAPGIVALLAERVSLMNASVRTPAVARVLSLITAGGNPGISLSKIAITPGESGKGAVDLSGKAVTRAALLSFVQKLQKEDSLSGVALPVSDLATGENVPFTLSFSYSLGASL